MRNRILKMSTAVAALAGAGGAQAVQLYGAVDTFVSYAKVGATSTAALQSGGTSTSRFGLRDSEDLGGGWKANFQLESGFEADTGRQANPGALFNRESWVGISHAQYGELRLGRVYPAYLPLNADPFYGVGKLSPFASFFMLAHDLGPGASAVAARQAKSIVYTTPSVGGATLKLLVAPSGNVTGPRTENAGAVAEVKQGPWHAAASYNAAWKLRAPGASQAVRSDIVSAALAHDFGKFTLLAAYNAIRPNADNTYLAQAATLGTEIKVGRDVIRASVAYRNVSGQPNSSVGVLVGYDYTLSKQSNLYARVGSLRNQGKGRMHYLAAPINTPGESMPFIVALGLRHKF